jgi:predicted dehydrogenase
MSPNPLRAAVVGTSFGARVHVPALRAAGIDVVALVGRDPVRTDQRARDLGIPLATTQLADAIAAGVDCVTVATPPDAHHEIVLDAIAAGCHVLCEKPFARTSAQAESMADAADRAGVVALLGCEFRWATDEALAARVIRSGVLGSVRTATFVQHSALVAHGLHGAFNDEWWFDAASGGGILNAAGIHYVDRFRVWLGEIRAVSALLQVVGPREPGQAEDTYTVLLRFESGCVGVLQHCAAARGDGARLCRVVGSAGTISLEGGEVLLADTGAARPLVTPPDLALPVPPAASRDPKHAFTTIELPPYTRLAERWRDLVLGHPIDPAAPPSPTFRDGVASQRVLDAIRASSAADGAWVTV